MTLGEKLQLAVRASERCVRRFGDLSRESSPQDVPLQRLLAELATEERRHLETLRKFAMDSGEPVSLDRLQAERLIRVHFPSLFRGFGEARLDRDVAMYFAECLEEEASRFYRRVGEDAADDEVRSFFLNMALGEWGRLEHLRTVLL